MAKIAFLISIRPGQRQAYINFARGLSGDELAPLYKQFGVTAHAAFVADDFVVSYYEAADPEQVRQMWALPAVQEVVRTQMSSMVEFNPLDLQFLEVAFDWDEKTGDRH